MKCLALILLLVPGLGFAVDPESAGRPAKDPTLPHRQHWAFLPLASVTPPPVPRPETGSNPVDAFIGERLRKGQLEPAPPAGRSELLRRITYDLAGRPPTVPELRAFLNDPAPDAYERVVDRLLGSVSFGERWAQHWLDLAHYADSNGFELDADRPDAWRYRDWVVQAFNDDLSYDRFVALQVAGDEVSPGSPEALIAAGFARSGPFEVVSGNIDPVVRRQNELTGVTATVGSVLMGLTIGCARCHDHKFDPLSAADYYRLQAFFAGAQFREVPLHDAAEKQAHQAIVDRINGLLKPLQEAKTQLEKPYKDRLHQLKEAGLSPREREVRDKPKEQRTPEEARLYEGTDVALTVTWEEIAEAVAGNPADQQAREILKHKIHALEQQLPRPPAGAMSLAEEAAPPPETRVLRRGNPKDPQALVEPAPPTVLQRNMTGGAAYVAPGSPLDSTHSGRRLALARWLVATNNPLTARVIVNRLWQHHFGRGLVGTPSDFGTRGDPPVNPELLDWLAQELIRNNWKLKPLHRLMVTSGTYQRSSRLLGANREALDPANLHFGRMNRQRMDAEALRDSVLAVAGLWNSRAGGPGVHVHLEPEVQSLIFTESEVVELWPVDPDPAEHWRRSIYLHRKRNVHYPLFDAFDAPDALTPCPQRPVSTHAPQALVMINGRFAQQAAGAMARSLMKGSPDDRARIREAYLRCYARTPTPEELEHTRDFVRRDSRPESDRWTDLALALINSNEFIYVP